MIIQATNQRQPPPLGHLTVKALTGQLVRVQQGQPMHSGWLALGVTVDDVRRELRRRERLGVGVRR